MGMISRNADDRIYKIAVIGDVHDLWEPEDELALQHLGVNLVLLVGDFGNEAVPLVRAIAQISLPKAVILGNHDAWYSASEWGRKKCPYDPQKEDWVQEQLDVLGAAHIGYGWLDFPEMRLSVVGGRPFSWGGLTWKNEEFYRDRYGVKNFADSTNKIMDAVEKAAFGTVIFLGHCGPQGLGDHPESPCGKDWQPLGGDFGDPDLAVAIAQSRAMGKHIPLVAFGHMHHRLRHTKKIQRTALVTDLEGTVYLNAACVPRIIQTTEGRSRNFSLVTLKAGRVTQASLVWVNETYTITSEQVLYADPFLEPLSEPAQS